MKVFNFLVLVFLVSCSSEQKEAIDSIAHQEKYSTFDKIFTNQAPIFRGYNLGDSNSEDIIQNDSLSPTDFYTFSILTNEETVNKIKLNVHIEDDQEALILLEDITNRYNGYLNNNKSPSSFVTWTFIDDNNLPVQITLIYEKELSTISLNIDYKSQR